MGEKSHLPKENGVAKQDHDNSDNDMPSDNNEDSSESEDLSPEEFQMLDNQLDALNSALDDIEQKNDNIHSQLLQLLQSNRDIRRQLQGQTSTQSQSNEEPKSQS